MIPLPFARENRFLKIIEIRAGKGLTRKLAEMGLLPGAYIKVVRSTGNGPLIIELHSSSSSCKSCSLCSWRLALSFGIAVKIFVEEI